MRILSRSAWRKNETAQAAMLFISRSVDAMGKHIAMIARPEPMASHLSMTASVQSNLSWRTPVLSDAGRLPPGRPKSG